MLTVNKTRKKREMTRAQFEELFDKMLACYEGAGVPTAALVEHRGRMAESPELRELLVRFTDEPDVEQMRSIGEEMRRIMEEIIPRPEPRLAQLVAEPYLVEEMPRTPLLCAVCGAELPDPVMAKVGSVRFGERSSMTISTFVGEDNDEGDAFTWLGFPCRKCELSLLREYVNQHEEAQS